MDKNERLGLIGGISGATLGTALWLVILGIVIKSALLITLPVIFGAICVYAAIRLCNLRPERRFSTLGLAIIWLIFWNVLLCNFYFERIPQSLGVISTGKNQFSLMHINGMFVLFFVIGCGFIIKDILRD